MKKSNTYIKLSKNVCDLEKGDCFEVMNIREDGRAVFLYKGDEYEVMPEHYNVIEEGDYCFSIPEDCLNVYMGKLSIIDKMFTECFEGLTPDMDIINKDENEGPQGLRYNEGKTKWGLVDFKTLEEMVKVLEVGAKKYSAWNWKGGMSHTEVSESLMRHLFAYLEGEDFDEETKCHHIGHVMCNAMFLMYNINNKPEFDDRFKKQ